MSKDKRKATESLFSDTGGQPISQEAPNRYRRRLLGKAAIVLILAGVVVTVIATKVRRKEALAPKPMAAQPTQETVLASVNGEEITLAQLEKSLQELPQQYRPAFKHKKHEFLERLIARKLLLQEARRLKVQETEAYRQALEEAALPPGQEEQVLINVFLSTYVLKNVEVTDAELRPFYEEHKAEIPGEPSFEEVKELLRSSAHQQKEYRAVERYIADLRQKASITLKERWIEAQKLAAADNPLQRALEKGKPVLADFGRGKCIPCKMMKPILDELKEEYQGKAEILIIEIDEHPALTRRCGIRTIPTQIFYDASGKEAYRHEGFMPREDIVEQLAKLGVR